MKTIEWDRVVSSTPLNTDAAIVRDGRGERNPLDKRKFKYSPEGPPPLVEISKEIHANPGFKDFTGSVVGRLTVLGLVDRDKAGFGDGAKGGRWAVRCVCGTYETRRTKVLRKFMASGQDIACCQCDYHSRIRSKEYQEQSWKKKESHET